MAPDGGMIAEAPRPPHGERPRLRETSPAGRFSERGPGTEVFVWRKGPRRGE